MGLIFREHPRTLCRLDSQRTVDTTTTTIALVNTITEKFFFTFDRLFGFFHKNDGSLKGDSVRRDAYVPKPWKNE